MKKRPVSWLANCWLSAMFPPAATTAPLIACTIPGPSMQLRVSTHWVPVGDACAVEVLTRYQGSGSAPAAPPAPVWPSAQWGATFVTGNVGRISVLRDFALYLTGTGEPAMVVLAATAEGIGHE